MDTARRKPNRKRALIGVAIALLGMLMLLVPSRYAYAAGRIDTSASTSLTLTYKHGSTVLPSVPVRIYKVATVDETCGYTLDGDFSSYSVVLDTSLTSSQWNSAAQTLAGYVTADGIKPLKSSETDASGITSFGPLTTGLYLVMADKTTVGTSTYSFSPFLVSLPSLDANDIWAYDVSSSPKSEQSIPSAGKKSYKVVKHWVDSGYEQKRPTSIAIELFKDGVSQGTQTLSADNNWSYTWEATTDDEVWTVAERNVPDGYTVVVTTDDTTTTIFTATNTYTPPTTPPTTTTTTTTTPGTPTTTTKTPGTPTTTTTVVKLPKTGDTTTYLPIVILALAGLVLLVAGWLARRRRGPWAGTDKSS